MNDVGGRGKLGMTPEAHVEALALKKDTFTLRLYIKKQTKGHVKKRGDSFSKAHIG